MSVLIVNNAVSLLASDISAETQWLQVLIGQGARFPMPVLSDDWFPIALTNDRGQVEYCRCTKRTGDALYVERAQEGSPSRAYEAGDLIDLRLTLAALDALRGSTPTEEFNLLVDDASIIMPIGAEFSGPTTVDFKLYQLPEIVLTKEFYFLSKTGIEFKTYYNETISPGTGSCNPIYKSTKNVGIACTNRAIFDRVDVRVSADSSYQRWIINLYMEIPLNSLHSADIPFKTVNVVTAGGSPDPYNMTLIGTDATSYFPPDRQTWGFSWTIREPYKNVSDELTAMNEFKKLKITFSK